MRISKQRHCDLNKFILIASFFFVEIVTPHCVQNISEFYIVSDKVAASNSKHETFQIIISTTTKMSRNPVKWPFSLISFLVKLKSLLPWRSTVKLLDAGFVHSPHVSVYLHRSYVNVNNIRQYEIYVHLVDEA